MPVPSSDTWMCVCAHVCVKRPVLPPCAVDGCFRNLLYYYYCKLPATHWNEVWLALKKFLEGWLLMKVVFHWIQIYYNYRWQLSNENKGTGSFPGSDSDCHVQRPRRGSLNTCYALCASDLIMIQYQRGGFGKGKGGQNLYFLPQMKIYQWETGNHRSSTGDH